MRKVHEDVCKIHLFPKQRHLTWSSREESHAPERLGPPVLTKEVPDALSHSMKKQHFSGDCLAVESQVCSLGVIQIPTSLLEMRGYSELGSVGHTLMLLLRHLKSDQH